jgi:hypothetical protein
MRTDICHNAEPGTFGHECGKRATWEGDKPSTLSPGKTYTTTFCDACKANGHEARTVHTWRRIGVQAREN